MGSVPLFLILVAVFSTFSVFHNCLGVLFSSLCSIPFYLFSPFLSTSGVLIFFPPSSYSLVSRYHLRKSGVVVRNSYAYTSFFTKSCFVFFLSFWKWKGNKKITWGFDLVIVGFFAFPPVLYGWVVICRI